MGSYVGPSKPYDINLFPHDFINEIKYLSENGLNFKTYNIKIKIRAFSCNAPARSFVCGVKGYNSLSGCHKCNQKGKSIQHVTTFSSSIGNLRSDDDYTQRIDQNFHQVKFLDRTLSLESVGVKMITQFPLDVMHLVDVVVTKKYYHCY